LTSPKQLKFTKTIQIVIVLIAIAFTMWSKITSLVRRNSSAPPPTSAAAPAPNASKQQQQQQQQAKVGPTGVPLPACSEPLVAYAGSPYGVAPASLVAAVPGDVGRRMTRSELREHIERLKQPVGAVYGVVQFDGFDVEFKHLETLEATREPKADYSAALAEPNVLKNRYANILPPEHSRVPLALAADAPPHADFVNANFVDSWCAPKRYIATQGPLPNTFADFWRMVWEHEVAVILMLTREIESGVVKCARYWPEPDDDEDDDDNDDDNDNDDDDSSNHNNGDSDDVNQKSKPKLAASFTSDLAYVTFDDLPAVEPADKDTEDPRQACYGDVRVLFRGKRSGDEFVVRQFDLRRGDVVRRLTMLQYTGWPDHGVPASPQGFVTLSRLADVANKSNTRANFKLAGRQRDESQKKRSALPPLVAHCSAGVGRTGTFITIHSLLERVKASPDEPLSVHETVHMIRGARPNSVQTKDQYRFCYLSLDEQIRNLELELAEAAAAKRSKGSRAKKKQRVGAGGTDEPAETSNTAAAAAASASATTSPRSSSSRGKSSRRRKSGGGGSSSTRKH
jgi:protein tyrosine phosphatase